MTNIGIISNIQPIVNVEKIESHISALLFLKTNHSYSIDIANKLSAISTHHLISSAKYVYYNKEWDLESTPQDIEWYKEYVHDRLGQIRETFERIKY
ncbi:MAG: hypothetical protein ACJ71G_10775 [Nitrososphaeraceae archaeon]